MSEQEIARRERLAYEKILYCYSSALERGDFDTIITILKRAETDRHLEQMIIETHSEGYQREEYSIRQEETITVIQQMASENEEPEKMTFTMHELEQSASAANEEQVPIPPPLEPVLSSSLQLSTRRSQAHRRGQGLAAVLVAVFLIVSSIGLFTSRHHTTAPGSHTSTSSVTKTVVAAQGRIILLHLNGDIEAVRGKTGQRIWSYALNQGDIGDPTLFTYRGLAAHDQAVYVMAKNRILVLNEENGQVLWQKVFPVQIEEISPNESQLLLDAGILYVSFESTPQSVVYAVRASDGQILWHVTSVDASPPLLTASNGTAYVAIQNAALTQTNIQARGGTDGKILWTYQSPGRVSFATVANKVLYVYAFPGAVPSGTKANKRLLAFKTNNGNLVWSREIVNGDYTANVIYAQGILILSETYMQICAYRAADGASLWCEPKQLNPSGDVSIANYTVSFNRLYVAVRTKQGSGTPSNSNPQTTVELKALSLQTGKVLWSSPLPDSLNGTISLSQVQLQQENLLVATGSVQISALDASSGRLLWQIQDFASLSPVLQILATP